MADWPEWWFECRKEQIKNYPISIVCFWQEFISGVIDVVSDDGMVDYRDPERVEAWAGGPWVNLQLVASAGRVKASFWTQREDMSPLHLFDKVFQIKDQLVDLAELGIEPQNSAMHCGAVIGKYLFGLRTMNRQ